MLTCYYQVDTVLQILLCVLSLIAVITLLSALLLSWRRYGSSRFLRTGILLVLLLLNIVLYVAMLIDSRFTEMQQPFHFHLPYVVLLVFVFGCLGYSVWWIINRSKSYNVINNTSVKEAFDNLPTGVCFFNEEGLPVLCNLAMHRFSFDVCGRDIQYITDLEECLIEEYVPCNQVKREGEVFILPYGKVFQLERRILVREDGSQYTQFIAPDITELYHTRSQLKEENAQLSRVQNDLKQLSANMVTITREEEILNTKMRVHDEMGKCLMIAQKCLREDGDQSMTENVVLSWQRAVSMLQTNNESTEEDLLYQVQKTCESLKLNLVQTGELPKEDNVAYILSCAVRECVTNAVRYAAARELFVEFTQSEESATVSITNNGKAPKGVIYEGGGLSNLRHRVENAGGCMIVQSQPRFQLIVTVPKAKENLL